MAYDTVGPLTYLVAFGGGVVSFLSPCVLPLVPGYLSIVTGLDVTTLREGGRQHGIRVLRDTGLFVAGFGTVFVLLGLSATTLGGVLFRNQLVLTRLFGVLVIALALFMLGSLWVRAPWLYQERRFQPDPGRLGPFAPPVVGAAFGLGWTPCIGPVLGSILAIAATEGRAWAGGSLLAAYSLGLGVPFLVAGLALGRLARVFGWVKRHYAGLVAGSSIVLALFGVLLLFNRLSWVTAQLQDGLRAAGLDWLVTLG